MIRAGLRHRLCPFCGSEDQEIIVAGVASVHCKECGTFGPGVDWPYFEPGSEEAHDKAKETMEKEAAERWNNRPFYADLFPDELETMVVKYNAEMD